MDSIYPRSWLCKVDIDRKPGEPYLTRYVIFRTKWASLYIHQFHASDYDVPHDHPWWWLSIPLRRGYIEHFIDGQNVERKVFRPIIRDPRSFHWVEVRKGDEGKVWTLFLMGKRIREWGFMTPDGWVDEITYQKRPKEEA